LLIGATALLAAACAPNGQERAVASPSSASSAGALRPVPAGGAVAGWEGGKWGTFHSQRFDFRLSLPDGKAWRIDDHKSSWLVATHGPTRSMVRARMFLTDHAQNRAKCEGKVREAEPSFPAPQPEQAFDDASEKVLADSQWDTRAVSFVAPAVASPKPRGTVEIGGPVAAPPSAEALRGTVLVFASNVRKCFGFEYTTEASGPDARAVLAARLADVRQRVVRELRFDHELDAPGRESLSAEPAGRLGFGRALRPASIASKFEALPGARLELHAGRAAYFVDAAQAATVGAVEMHTRPFVEGEGPLVEVSFHGRFDQIGAPEAFPADQVLRRDQDVALAALATRATAGAIERFAGVGIDGRGDGANELGIEGGRGHGNDRPSTRRHLLSISGVLHPRTCE
jgi:hypothetical protein